LELVQAKASEFPETLVRNHVYNVVSSCNTVIYEAEDLTHPSRWKDAKDMDVERLQGSIQGSTSALRLALEILALYVIPKNPKPSQFMLTIFVLYRRSAAHEVPRSINLEFKQASTTSEALSSTVTAEVKALPRAVTVRLGERSRDGTSRDSTPTATVNTIATQTNDNCQELRLQIIVGNRERRYPPAPIVDHTQKEAREEGKQTHADKRITENTSEDKHPKCGRKDVQPDNTDGSPQNVARKWKSVRDVFLFKGHLILDMPCPRAIRTILEIAPDSRSEYSHLRYSAVTCGGEEFATDPSWKLRSSLFSQPRTTGLFISVAVSKSSDILSALQKIWATFDAMDDRARLRGNSSFKDDWKRRIVHIHCPIYPGEEVQRLFNEIGVRPKTPDRAAFLDVEVDSEVFSETESVGGTGVLWYMYEVRRLDSQGVPKGVTSTNHRKITNSTLQSSVLRLVTMRG